MMSAETGEAHGHGARLAAELGALGLAGLAAAGFYVHHHHQIERRKAELRIPAGYQDRLSIFNNAHIESRLKNGRHLIAAVAVHIYYASQFEANPEGVITKQQLLADLHASSDETLHVTDRYLQEAIGFLQLKGKEVIDRRPSTSNVKSKGYYALDVLEWAYREERLPAIVRRADEEYWANQPSDNS
jgi:hypothetical protein